MCCHHPFWSTGSGNRLCSICKHRGGDTTTLPTLYRRSKRDFLLGSVVANRWGTFPIMVLKARGGRWSLPTSWPAWPAYNSWLPDASGGYRVEQRRWLGDLLARAAGELLPHRLDHLLAAREALERLGDRLAKLGEVAAAARALGRRRDHDALARCGSLATR
jgi:hypothetical protein